MAIRAMDNVPVLDASAKLTDPAQDAVVADSGAVATKGLYEVRFILGASAAATMKLQRRNAANSGNVGDIPIVFVPAGASAEFILNYSLDASERVRAVMEAALTGDAAGAIQIEALA